MDLIVGRPSFFVRYYFFLLRLHVVLTGRSFPDFLCRNYSLNRITSTLDNRRIIYSRTQHLYHLISPAAWLNPTLSTLLIDFLYTILSSSFDSALYSYLATGSSLNSPSPLMNPLGLIWPSTRYTDYWTSCYSPPSLHSLYII